MAKITFQNKKYERLENVSVLDTLLNAGNIIPHGCKSGICQSCLMRASEGVVPKEAKIALKETQQEKNYFLACSCYPDNDLTVELPSEVDIIEFRARVLAKDLLNEDVIQLRLSIPEGFDYRAGQFINLIKDAENQRSYSLASVPVVDEFLELQIKIIENGIVSGWIKNDLSLDDEVILSEAHGDCYYSAGSSDQSILLIGTGTGLAPLYGILRDALQQAHQGDIHLFHGAAKSNALYLVKELTELAETYPNFHYTGCVSQGETIGKQVAGRANDIALQRQPDLKGWKVYLCGNPNMVESTRKKVFLAGANIKDILVDAFKFAKN